MPHGELSERVSRLEGEVTQRVARVESELAIRQLAARHALAVEARDVDALVALFVPDVDCGRWGTGGDSLAAYYRRTLTRFGRSVHLTPPDT
jgi:hypothetical protein